MFATGPIACAAALAPSTASTPPHHAKYVFFDPGMSGSSRKKSIRRISVAIRDALVANPQATIEKYYGFPEGLLKEINIQIFEEGDA